MTDFLKCLECGYKLAPVGKHKGYYAIMMHQDGVRAVILRAEIECPICGARRNFCAAKALDSLRVIDVRKGL